MGLDDELGDAHAQRQLQEPSEHDLDHLLERSRSLTKKEATSITGGLSRTSKMPCHSWGIPAADCRLGSILATIEGTVCHDCYAGKGAYTWPRVRRAYERRLAKADHPDWTMAMVALVLWQAQHTGEPYFRWFDSGDLQSVDMLQRIATVARATPEVRHWLPTREHAIVRRYLAAEARPANLTIRLSAHLVDGAPPRIYDLPTSTVHRRGEPIGYECPAYQQRPAKCSDCRACWDPTVFNVSYPHH